MSFVTLLQQLGTIALAIGGLGFVIAFHELGHWLFCKLFRIYTPTFSIGMGPRIIEKKVGDTTFTLSAIPLGGYVEMADVPTDGSVPSNFMYQSFSSRPYYQKLLVFGGGILCNLIFAYTAAIAVFALGAGKTTILLPSNATPIVASVKPNSPAALVGIQPGDILVNIGDFAVNDTTVSSYLGYLQQHAKEALTLEVLRGAESLYLPITLGDGVTGPLLGVTLTPRNLDPQPLGSALQSGVQLINRSLAAAFGSFVAMFKSRSAEGLGGPISIIAEISQSTKDGASSFFLILAFISVYLAALNTLPLPIFDGGQALFCTLQTITRRPLETLRLYMGYASWALILGLSVALMFKDIIKLCR